MGIEITSETGEVVIVQDPAATVRVSNQSPTVEINQAPPPTVSVVQPGNDVVTVDPAEQNVVDVNNLRGPPGLDGIDGVDGTDGTDGTDGVDGADGVVQTLVEGSGIHVNSTDPAHPVISATGGGGGGGAADSVTLSCTAGETVSGHRAVTPDVTGAVFYTSPSTIGNQPVWVTTMAIDAADVGSVVALGAVVEPSWNWSPGNIYLSANGFLTQTEPTSGALVIVALATSPTSIFVDRYPTIDL